ncbi:MAG: hypothetical protein J3R72DRAFT_449684 [Linnemannia gamsii]|nr:MAG: hypothetical protein J3R72DRAFT_449684 [Linnemannia gamsii]
MKFTITILAVLSITAFATAIAYPRPDSQEAIGKRVIAPVPGAVAAAPMHTPTVAPQDMKRRADLTATRTHTNKTTGAKSNADKLPQKHFAMATKTEPNTDMMLNKRAEANETNPGTSKTPDPLKHRADSQ